MLSSKEGTELIKIARGAIKDSLDGESVVFDNRYENNQGVFVTLYSYPKHELRGCIGFPYPTMPLMKAVVEAARAAAFRDPRFESVKKDELNKIIMEISVLTVPEEIKAKPEELAKQIKIGRDGLICEYRGYQGLLLPQVATEQKWNAQKFLEQTCIKAGLSKDAYKNKDCTISRFQAQIFAEEKPEGKVSEKK